MSNKKPAHEVIVEMIKKIIRVLSKDDDTDDLIMTGARLGILAAELEILKQMDMKEKHREDVINALRQIKTDCPLNYVDKPLTDELFLAIAAP